METEHPVRNDPGFPPDPLIPQPQSLDVPQGYPVLPYADRADDLPAPNLMTADEFGQAVPELDEHPREPTNAELGLDEGSYQNYLDAQPATVPVPAGQGGDQFAIVGRVLAALVVLIVLFGGVGFFGFYSMAWDPSVVSNYGPGQIAESEAPAAEEWPQFSERFPGFVELDVTTGEDSTRPVGLVVDDSGHVVVRSDWLADADSIKVLFDEETSKDAKIIGADQTWNITVLQVGNDPRLATPPAPAEWADAETEDVSTVSLYPVSGSVEATDASAKLCTNPQKLTCGSKLDNLVSIESPDAAEFSQPAIDPDGKAVAFVIGVGEDDTHVYGLGHDQLMTIVSKILKGS
jgi:hypothetical protein